jgi:ABC-type phosphate transport system substrate-binding protein
MKNIGRKGLAAVAVGALTFGLMTVGGNAAHADVAPSGSDIVGVGSDTLQYMLDFGADGDLGGDPGYNTAKLSRLVSFDATPDANARAGYLNGSTASGLKPLNPTVVLRAGTSPVQRPNGSGAGIGALAIDSGPTEVINFARSSSALSSANVATAHATGGVGDLHEVRLAKDTLTLATANTTNAVALTAAQLKSVYQCSTGATKWSDFGGSSSDTIIPIIPQLGSGTRKTFLTDLGFSVDSNGNATPALGGCVKTYEENDPYALYVDSSGNQVADPYATSAVPNADAIEPMSGGRLNLYAAGYFYNPNVAYKVAPPAGESGVLHPQVKLLTGGSAYNDVRGLYVIFRQSDVTSTTHFNGSTKNWVQTLFLNSSSTPFFKSGAGQALLAAAGVTPDYGDCGVNPTDTSTCPPL